MVRLIVISSKFLCLLFCLVCHHTISIILYLGLYQIQASSEINLTIFNNKSLNTVKLLGWLSLFSKYNIPNINDTFFSIRPQNTSQKKKKKKIEDREGGGEGGGGKRRNKNTIG